jgi:hypothetical protein
MELEQTEIDFVNARILSCLGMTPPLLVIPMYRAVLDGQGTWIIVPDLFRFYEDFSNVQRFRSEPIEDNAFSAALSANPAEYQYCMGLMQYFRSKRLVWLVERTKLILTPKDKAPPVPSKLEKAFSSALDTVLGRPHGGSAPDAKAKVRPPAKAHVGKHDIIATELLLSVDIGRSTLAKIDEEVNAALLATVAQRIVTASSPRTSAPPPVSAPNPFSPPRRTEEEAAPLSPPSTPRTPPPFTVSDSDLPALSPRDASARRPSVASVKEPPPPRGDDEGDDAEDSCVTALASAMNPSLVPTLSRRKVTHTEPEPADDANSSSSSSSSSDREPASRSPAMALGPAVKGHARSQSVDAPPTSRDGRAQGSSESTGTSSRARQTSQSFITVSRKQSTAGSASGRRPSNPAPRPTPPAKGAAHMSETADS